MSWQHAGFWIINNSIPTLTINKHTTNADESYQRHLFYLLLGTILFKLALAPFIELGNDEVYYYTYALQPDWNHFDHPPMVGWMIRFCTINLYWVNELSMRLGAILGGAIATFFVFKTGTLLHNAKTGWYAALIYNCSIYTGIIAGFFILPDSPQMPFYTLAIYLFTNILLLHQEKKIYSWLLLGLVIGCSVICKIHGIYLWAGIGLFLLFKRPTWLLNYRLYVAGILTLLIASIIVYWNFQNDFITYRFHSERVTPHSIHFDDWLQEIIGEFLYQNPLNIGLMITAIIAGVRHKNLFTKEVNALLWCLSLPMLALFWAIALFNPTLPHWSGPAYIPLMFIAAKYLSNTKNSIVPLILKIAGSLIITLCVVAAVAIHSIPFNIGSQQPKNYGENCPTLDISGWKDAGKQFQTLFQQDIAQKKMPPNAPILVNRWFPGGHELFYIARQTHQSIIGIGTLEDIHKFAWLNTMMDSLHLGADAYAIVPSNTPSKAIETFTPYFQQIEKPDTLAQIRGGKAVRFFWVYRLRNCVRLPASLLQNK